MVLFRPHSLNVIRPGGDGGYDENGDFVGSEEVIAYSSCPCRYEPNGSAKSIALPDGTAYTYSYIVYLNIDTEREIKYGDIVELFDADGKSIGRYPVNGFHRGQLNEKVWL